MALDSRVVPTRYCLGWQVYRRRAIALSEKNFTPELRPAGHPLPGPPPGAG